MKVSVIVPAFNNGRFIHQCINSIQNQTYKNIEIVIVNDGSTDDTKEILNDYSLIDKRIKVLNQKNSGTLMARVNGIKNSTGDTILNLDSDDFLEPNAVELLVEKMRLTKADIVIGNHYLHKNGRKTLIENKIPENDSKISKLEYLLLGQLTGYIWGRLFKRNLLENIELPVERAYSEDVLINFYVFCNHNVRLALVEEAILNYIMHETNVSNSENSVVVEGFFDEGMLIEKILTDSGVSSSLKKELAAFNCRNWVVYCRKKGIKTKDKKFHWQFYNTNFKLGKQFLPFYQKIEMFIYARSLRLGYFVTSIMKWSYNKFQIFRITN